MNENGKSRIVRKNKISNESEPAELVEISRLGIVVSCEEEIRGTISVKFKFAILVTNFRMYFVLHEVFFFPHLISGWRFDRWG